MAAASLTALSLTASASPAAASVTIGQLAPATPSVDCTGADFDHVQPSVTSGTSYVVPPLPPASALVISFWSHNAAAAAGQVLTMKVFRKVADPATYVVVGHDGPRPLTASTLNTFSASVPVKPGDVLGLNSTAASMTGCAFPTLGESRLVRAGNLANGESGAFISASPDRRLNVSAVVEPDADGDGFGDETQDGCPTVAANQGPCNDFTLGKLKGKKLSVTVPGAGEVEVTDAADTSAGGASAAAKKKRLKPSSATAAGAGTVEVKLRLTKTAKKKLKQKRKVKVNAAITYTPTGGTANTETAKLRVKK